MTFVIYTSQTKFLSRSRIDVLQNHRHSNGFTALDVLQLKLQYREKNYAGSRAKKHNNPTAFFGNNHSFFHHNLPTAAHI